MSRNRKLTDWYPNDDEHFVVSRFQIYEVGFEKYIYHILTPTGKIINCLNTSSYVLKPLKTNVKKLLHATENVNYILQEHTLITSHC